MSKESHLPLAMSRLSREFQKQKKKVRVRYHALFLPFLLPHILVESDKFAANRHNLGYNTKLILHFRNNKGDSIAASYYHLVNSTTAVGGEMTHSFSSNENTLTFGTQHALDPLTTVKARLNNYGMASALIQHEWRPKSLVTISTEVDTKAIEKSSKVGLSLVLKP